MATVNIRRDVKDSFYRYKCVDFLCPRQRVMLTFGTPLCCSVSQDAGAPHQD